MKPSDPQQARWPRRERRSIRAERPPGTGDHDGGTSGRPRRAAPRLQQRGHLSVTALWRSGSLTVIKANLVGDGEADEVVGYGWQATRAIWSISGTGPWAWWRLAREVAVPGTGGQLVLVGTVMKLLLLVTVVLESDWCRRRRWRQGGRNGHRWRRRRCGGRWCSCESPRECVSVCPPVFFGDDSTMPRHRRIGIG